MDRGKSAGAQLCRKARTHLLAMQSSLREKRLRIGLTYNSVADLPAHSEGHQKDSEAIYSAAAKAGYEAMQGGSAQLCKAYGLQIIGSGVVPAPADAEAFVEHWKRQGAIAATCIAGYGYESDGEIDALAGLITHLAATYNLPVYIETHRGSITQDAWRTVELTKRLPSIRFNGDFSHWFTGQEMPYGDFDERLNRLKPVFERVRFLHGRIGNRCCMQVDIGEGLEHPSIPYFRSFWVRAMTGFLKAYDSGRDLWFCPELLGSEYQYAHLAANEYGDVVELSDRWSQSTVLVRLAKSYFAEAVAGVNKI